MMMMTATRRSSCIWMQLVHSKSTNLIIHYLLPSHLHSFSCLFNFLQTSELETMNYPATTTDGIQGCLKSVNTWAEDRQKFRDIASDLTSTDKLLVRPSRHSILTLV